MEIGKIVKFLKQQPLFEGFSTDTLQEIVNQSTMTQFETGETVIPFGQHGKVLGVILGGAAEAVVEEAGQRRRLGTLGEGDFFGEMSLLTGDPTGAEVLATQPTETLSIPQATFTRYLVANPKAIQLLAGTLADRLRARDADPDAQERLAQARRDEVDPYGLALVTPGKPLKVLVFNVRKNSLNYNFYNTRDTASNFHGVITKIGTDDVRHRVTTGTGTTIDQVGNVDHRGAVELALQRLFDSENGVIEDISEISVVGHRVVHGGERYNSAVAINDEVVEEIRKCSTLAPLHNPLNVLGIEAAREMLPDAIHVAVFDTAFHQTLPSYAYLYGLPYEIYREDKIRRYGFHGTSHHYSALKAATYLKRQFSELKMITLHLSDGLAGSSTCAIEHGRSVDTSMGFTPMEGLIMGTRVGNLDPAIVGYLITQKGMTPGEVEEMLNTESGLLGLSGISSEMQDIQEAADSGDRKARRAVLAYIYQLRKSLGAYYVALGGLDALVITGSVGEANPAVRAQALQGLAYMGIVVDEEKNRGATAGIEGVVEISQDSSPVKVLVVATDDARMIARDAIQVAGFHDISEHIRKRHVPIPVSISAHHIHLSRREMDALFGKGSELTPRTDLSQPGQYASTQTVNLVGPKGRVERVRVLGPLRKKAQVEIARTEEFKLGIDAPIRMSGDTAGSPGLILEGAEGSIEIEEGVICAQRHIHMTPEDALAFGVKDGDVVSIRVEGKRSLTFGDVVVRVHPSYRLDMHVDTDEANAAELGPGAVGYLEGIQSRRA